MNARRIELPLAEAVHFTIGTCRRSRIAVVDPSVEAHQRRLAVARKPTSNRGDVLLDLICFPPATHRTPSNSMQPMRVSDGQVNGTAAPGSQSDDVAVSTSGPGWGTP